MVRFQCGKCSYIGSPGDFRSNSHGNGDPKKRKRTRTCPSCGSELEVKDLHLISGAFAKGGRISYQAGKSITFSTSHYF